MEQEYILVKHGRLSLYEIAEMTAEDRKWWIERINKDIEEENKKNKGGGGQHMPSVPKPNIPKPSIPRG